MDVDMKEKLIEMVKNYECLYNRNDKAYNHKSYKLMLWEKIATALELDDAFKAKDMWRVLRDGYVRYKKIESRKKYCHYTWSSQLAFLDGMYQLRSTSPNRNVSQQSGSDSPELQGSEQFSTISHQFSALEPGPSYVEIPLEPQATDTASPHFYAELPKTQNPLSLPPSPKCSYVSKIENNRNYSMEKADKVLEHVKRKKYKGQEFDEVYHLFASYGKTFKKLMPRNQAELKAEVAKLFAQAELREIDSGFQIEEQVKRKVWVDDDIDTTTEERSEYQELCRELDSDEDRFYVYFHMSKSSFETLHNLVKPLICKLDTNYRKAIGTRERLAICLRYIRTGDSFLTISSSFRVGRSTVSMIVAEVAQAIWKVVQPIYMPNPTEYTWKESELGFREIWKFPNCVGAINGKHVRIKCPQQKNNPSSIVLLAIADPFHKFIMVDVGTYGLRNDTNILEKSELYGQYLKGKSLLRPKPLPGTSEPPVSHVLVGDEAFILQPYLMRPFPTIISKREPDKSLYNYRLCRARRIIEKTFLILTEKWKVFHRPLECNVDKAIHVIKAACCLHNYVRTKEPVLPNENEDDIKEEVREKPPKIGSFYNFKQTNIRSSNKAISTREAFLKYFNQIDQENPVNVCNENSENIYNENPENICNENPVNVCNENPVNVCNENPLNDCNENPENIYNDSSVNVCNENPVNVCNENPLNVCNENPVNICNENG